jgi:hypothetical protein
MPPSLGPGVRPILPARHRRTFRVKGRPSSPDGLTVQASRRSAFDPLVVSATLGTSNKPTAESSRQLHASEGRPAYAAVVAGRTIPQQTSGHSKPKANDSDTSEPAAFPEVAIRRMSCADTSGPLGGMPGRPRRRAT